MGEKGIISKNTKLRSCVYVLSTGEVQDLLIAGTLQTDASKPRLCSAASDPVSGQHMTPRRLQSPQPSSVGKDESLKQCCQQGGTDLLSTNSGKGRTTSSSLLSLRCLKCTSQGICYGMVLESLLLKLHPRASQGVRSRATARQQKVRLGPWVPAPSVLSKAPSTEPPSICLAEAKQEECGQLQNCITSLMRLCFWPGSSLPTAIQIAISLYSPDWTFFVFKRKFRTVSV